MNKIIGKVNRHKVQLGIIILFAIIIRLSYLIYLFEFKYITQDKTKKLIVSVIQNEGVSETKITYLVKYNKDKFLLDIYKSDKEYFGNSQGDFLRYSKYTYGDILSLNGKINIPDRLKNPYEFDYKKYLNSRNVCGIISTYDVDYVDKVIQNPLLNLTYYLKGKISDRLSQKMPTEQAELFKSMIYGDDRFLDVGVKNTFMDIGISHLIAVSGSNVASVVFVVFYITNLLKINRQSRAIIITFFIVIFSVIASLEVTVVRASVMAITLQISELLDIKIGKIKSLAIAFLIIVAFNPYCIFSVGFVLSFFATLSIIIYFKKIVSFFDSKIFKVFGYLYRVRGENKKIIKTLVYNILKNINMLFSLSLSVVILIFPIQIFYFNTFPLSSFVSNIIVIAISSLQRILGFITLFLIFVPYISDILANANSLLLKTIMLTANSIHELNIPQLRLQTPNNIQLILYYLVLYLFYLREYFKTRLNKYIFLKEVKIKVYGINRSFKIRKIDKQKILRLVKSTIFLLAFLIIQISIYYQYFDNYIVFFNVQQGNMAFIRFRGKNILIDAGSTKTILPSNVLIDFLNAKNIDKIDLALFSHMHSDHINGYERIAKDIEIKTVAFSTPKKNGGEDYASFTNVNNELEIPLINLKDLDEIYVGDVRITMISPPDNEIINSTDVTNSNSSCYLINVNDKNIAFFGDATKETEKYLVERYIKSEKFVNIKNILQNLVFFQVAHHGSKTSTSSYFVENIKAKEAVVSSKKDEFGHPHKDTLEVLKKYNIKARITEDEGAIKYRL